MEPLTLHISPAARAELQALAEGRGVSEAELATQLLLRALRRDQHAEAVRDAREHMSGALRTRLSEVADAFEALEGPPR